MLNGRHDVNKHRLLSWHHRRLQKDSHSAIKPNNMFSFCKTCHQGILRFLEKLGSRRLSAALLKGLCVMLSTPKLLQETKYEQRKRCHFPFSLWRTAPDSRLGFFATSEGQSTSNLQQHCLVPKNRSQRIQFHWRMFRLFLVNLASQEDEGHERWGSETIQCQNRMPSFVVYTAIHKTTTPCASDKGRTNHHADHSNDKRQPHRLATTATPIAKEEHSDLSVTRLQRVSTATHVRGRDC